MITLALAVSGCGTEQGLSAEVVEPTLSRSTCLEHTDPSAWPGPWDLEVAWQSSWQEGAGWFNPILLVPGAWLGGADQAPAILSTASATGLASTEATVLACTPPCTDWEVLDVTGRLGFAVATPLGPAIGLDKLVSQSLWVSGEGGHPARTFECPTSLSTEVAPVTPAPHPEDGSVVLVNAAGPCDPGMPAAPGPTGAAGWGQVIPTAEGLRYLTAYREHDVATGAVTREIGGPSPIERLDWTPYHAVHTMVLGDPPTVVEVGGGMAHGRWLSDGTERTTIDFSPMAVDGEPCAGDLDGDGRPEIVVSLRAWSGGDAFRAYDLDGLMLWSDSTENESGGATCTVADLDGDGAGEVLLLDERSFRIVDGPTGAVRFEDRAVGSHTAHDHPIVGDLDGDGSSEIVLASSTAWWRDDPSKLHALVAYTHPLGILDRHPPFWPGTFMHHTNVDADGALVPDPAPWWEDPRTDGHHLMVRDDMSCPDIASTRRETCLFGRDDVEIAVDVENIGGAAVDGEVEVELWVAERLVSSVWVAGPEPGGTTVVRLRAAEGHLGAPTEVRIRFEDGGPHAGCENPRLWASW